MSNSDLLGKCSYVADELIRREKEIADARASIGFLYKSSFASTRGTARMLKMFKQPLSVYGERKGITGKGEEIAFLMPYNMGTTWSVFIAQQLAVGNRVRMKPSEIDTRTGEILGDIWEKVAPGEVAFDFRRGPEFMEWAIAEPRVKAVVLFGYHTVALSYMDKIVAAKKRFIFHGPGKNPFIVLEDANPKEAANGLFLARFGGYGQGCGSPGRMYIHSAIYEEFLDHFVKLTRKLVAGDSKDPKTDVGPLGSPLAITRIKNQLEDAKSKGARILCGGKIEGNLLHPTVVVDCNHSMLGLKEESFGPVCWFMPFNEVEEAIALAKDSDLAHSLYVHGFKGLGKVLAELQGVPFLIEVDDYVFGRFGNVRVNPDLSQSARRDVSYIYIPRGEYGYSCWITDYRDGELVLKQGPKIDAIELSKGIRER
ncbi:MAG: aldehyde dehydrogenase family protein [Chloroflexi bacterium]|nr:aldehyde dehydrogenase family protein [Chloroflexota bacterium]